MIEIYPLEVKAVKQVEMKLYLKVPFKDAKGTPLVDFKDCQTLMKAIVTFEDLTTSNEETIFWEPLVFLFADVENNLMVSELN